MTKNIRILIFTLLLFPFLSFSQFPDLQFNISNLTVGAGGTVNVPVTAGTNWSNISKLQEESLSTKQRKEIY